MHLKRSTNKCPSTNWFNSIVISWDVYKPRPSIVTHKYVLRVFCARGWFDSWCFWICVRFENLRSRLSLIYHKWNNPAPFFSTANYCSGLPQHPQRQPGPQAQGFRSKCRRYCIRDLVITRYAVRWPAATLRLSRDMRPTKSSSDQHA